MDDTHPAAARRYYELLTQRSPAERLSAAVGLCTAVRTLAEAGIFARTPDASRREVQRALADRLYGAAVAEKLFPRK